MNSKEWFSTSIYYALLSRNASPRFNKEVEKECYQIRDYDKAGKEWCTKNYPSGYTSYSSICQLHLFSSTFAEIEKNIRKHVYKFSDILDFDLQGRTLQMTDCWINIMPFQVIHSLHLHPLSCISGTYYIKAPKNCSQIKFEDPRTSRFMAAPPRKTNCAERNQQYVKYSAEAGKLILFESWLRHEVEANPSKEERISMSFNYGWV